MNDIIEYRCNEFLSSLKEIRVKAGISTEQLAELSGLKETNILKIETGVYMANLETLIRIAEALHMHLRLMKNEKK